MNPRLQISRSGVELIKTFEGFRAKASQLDDGGWTIGYGHTLTARQGASVSQADAEALLLYDLINVSHAVNEWSYTPLTQNEFDALVSFAFNIGVTNFRRSSTLRRLNEGRKLEAALAMELWRKSDMDGTRIVIDSLVRRRAAEKALFLMPMNGWVPAPSSLVPPKIDYDAAASLPLETPAVFRHDFEADRAIAERDHGPELVSSSEAAAANVIARLSTILPDNPPTTAAEAGDDGFRLEPASERDAKAAAAGAGKDAPLKLTAKTPPKAASFFFGPDGRIYPLWLVSMGAVGLAAMALAVSLILRPGSEPALGVPTVYTGVVIFILGVALGVGAIFLLLDRIGARTNTPPT